MKLHVEYCGQCGYKLKFDEMCQEIKKSNPNIEIDGSNGRKGAFEVKLDESVIHSRLSTLAFPVFSDINNIISEVNEGKPARKATQQPINECTIS